MKHTNDFEKLLKVALTALAADAANGQLVEEQAVIATVEILAGVAPSLDSAARHLVVQELLRRLNVWSGQGATLVGEDPNHRDWLAAKRESIKWSFWNRYRQFLESKMPPRVVNELDSSTDEILGLLEDPARVGAWRRQGMVVGHVQSGKTASYTGLICKAADAGYKVVVVLSGIHNSLRAQTQVRLDEGFLGYSRPLGGNVLEQIPLGVGHIDPTLRADSVTTRHEQGDFSRRMAQGFQIHAGGRVLLFVVKKNKSVLSNLVSWAKLSASKKLADGRTVVPDAPLLVIDDEADQASIDIKFQPIDEETGIPDKDHEPAAINGLIRRLLETFERRAYVGYTATPFANVFVHPDASTQDHGPDLFPKHFIHTLSAPSDYFGPLKVFGDDESQPRQGIVPSRIRFVADADAWIPPQHKGDIVPRYAGAKRVPPSLEVAVRAFVLACSARRARGQAAEHKSMLVHVSRFTAVQRQVHELVRQLVDDLKDRWRARLVTPSDPLVEELRTQWEEDFLPTTSQHGGIAIDWEYIEPHVWHVLGLIKVNLINAKASDALIYEEHRATGLHVIAVGGDKLSRGLTLEGLTVSYFLRSARMYDTLMQMGRWFGYRPGYEDLCRLYLTEELAEWYGHITEAAEELRQEFDRMVLLGGSPENYGLRVRTHPVLAITGRLRPGTPELRTSLSATAFEPTVLKETEGAAEENWKLSAEFIERLGKPTQSPVHLDLSVDGIKQRRRWPGGAIWKGVTGADVLAFLEHFEFADEHLVRTPPSAVRGYVRGRMAKGELTTWSVAVLGKEDAEENQSDSGIDPGLDISVSVAGRKIWTLYRRRITTRPGNYILKRIGSPGDEAIDLPREAWLEVDEELKRLGTDPQRTEAPRRGRLFREKRGPERGLLILYLLTPGATAPEPARSVPMVAPFISFPKSADADANPVSYAVNRRYWLEEIGGVE